MFISSSSFFLSFLASGVSTAFVSSSSSDDDEFPLVEGLCSSPFFLSPFFFDSFFLDFGLSSSLSVLAAFFFCFLSLFYEIVSIFSYLIIFVFNTIICYLKYYLDFTGKIASDGLFQSYSLESLMIETV